MKLKSINPKNNKLINSWEVHSTEQVDALLSQANQTYQGWMETDLSFRINCLEEISNLLRERAKEYAIIMANEMGKPLTQGMAEIENVLCFVITIKRMPKALNLALIQKIIKV